MSNHNDKNIQEINLNRKFLEQNFQIEICENEKFVPFRCIKVHSIEQLKFLFNELLNLEKEDEILYRGQANSDWFLDSTLERELEKYGVSITEQIENKIWDEFRQKARGKLQEQSLLKYSVDQVSTEDKRELWAIGRHYDLKTPLIDWSASLYVALFMAYAEVRKENEVSKYSALYIINRSYFPEYRNMVERYWFTSVSDYYGRITAQKGFLSHYSIRNEITAQLNRGECQAFKVYISNDLRNEILTYLKHIGIEYTTMYPDLLGVIKSVNNSLEECLVENAQQAVKNS